MSYMKRRAQPPGASKPPGASSAPRMLAIGSGGNKFIELLAEAHELRVSTGESLGQAVGRGGELDRRAVAGRHILHVQNA